MKATIHESVTNNRWHPTIGHAKLGRPISPPIHKTELERGFHQGLDEYTLTRSIPSKKMDWVGMNVVWGKASFDVFIEEEYLKKIVENTGLFLNIDNLNQVTKSIIFSNLSRPFRALVHPAARTNVISQPDFKPHKRTNRTNVVCLAIIDSASDLSLGHLSIRASQRDLKCLVQEMKDLRLHLEKYAEVERLLRIGKFEPGKDEQADQALAAMPKIMEFLDERTSDSFDLVEKLENLLGIFDAAI